MKTKIIIDSTTNVKKELYDQFDIVPLTVHFGSEEYTDGVTISHREFYRKLEKGNVLPTTSQPSPQAFEAAFKRVTEQGCDAVAVTVASGLSGTYQSAAIAAEEFGGRVYVVDSCNVAIGAGLLAEMALAMAQQGRTAAEIAAALEKEKKNIRILAVLDTLEYLKKGGRISSAVAVAGGLLNIKPVAAIMDGQITLAAKARGTKQAVEAMLSEIDKMGGIDYSKPFLLGYTGVNDSNLQSFINDKRTYFKTDTLNTSHVGSVVGTHAGPGAIAIAFSVK